MNLILSGRGVELDEPLRRYATEKLTRIQRFFDRIIKMEAQITEERNRHGVEHRVDVMVQTPGETLRAHGEGADLFAAIDKVADRIETQVKKFKDRLIDSHRGRRLPETEPLDIAEVAVDPDSEIVRRPAQAAKPLTLEEARLELESRGLTFLFFTNAESMQPNVLYRRKTGFGLVEPEA
ncbi:MAG TPA: ribosome-associated translation inhibitor RaiA [Actinomycetota bacterium]|jgi:putative sigma-54 modulation protein|nr:ribosome-associated translation inhibitor RaiA [Actinomycetota bacterium]